MTTSLIIPFTSTDERRNDIFDWVTNRWETLFPKFEVCIGTDDSDTFSRSRARNRAYEQTSGDIIVVSDADTACNVEMVYAAIDQVRATNGWVIAHTTYWSLTEQFTDELLTKHPTMYLRPPFPCNWRMQSKSEAGVLVMPRAAYDKVGGYDERFKGWGYEDNAFAYLLNHRWGRASRTPGDMLHLWHDPGENFAQPFIHHNERLYEEIRHAA